LYRQRALADRDEGDSSLSSVAPGTWAAFEKDLREAIGEARFRMWLQGHTRFTLEGKQLSIGVPNRFYRDWLDAHYRNYIEGSVARTLGDNIAVRFRIDPELFRAHRTESDEVAAAPAEGDSTPKPAAADKPTLPSTSRYALARFVAGSANRVAYAAASTLVEDPRRAHSPLYIFGGNGLGKTHLLRGIEDECLRRHRLLRVVATSGEEFTNAFVEAVKGHRLTGFRSRLRGADLLIVDDVQFIAGKPRTQEEFLHTLNALDAKGAKVVLAASHHPRKLERMPIELQGRLMAGMVARIDPLDLDLRRQIVVDKSAARNLELSADVVDFLAENLRASVSELEGAVNYLEHYRLTFARRLSVDAVRAALADVIRNSIPVIRVDEVRERFCKLFGINPKGIGVKKRTRSVSQPRMLALYLARKYTSATYTEIGREIGGLNHSSVIAAEKRIKEELVRDGDLVLGDRTWKVRDAIEAFEREIGPR
jgi:chromosomal replication initiator protein